MAVRFSKFAFIQLGTGSMSMFLYDKKMNFKSKL